MLRRALIAASDSSVLRHVATEYRIPRAVAMRFVAGETLDDAVRVTDELNGRGMGVSLDYLGESVDDASVARQAADAYLAAFERLGDRDAGVSVKPTQLGLEISPDLARDLIGEVCAAAGDRHVTIDMEGSDHTQATVDLVLALRSLGHENVGCAVQSYLYRTADDVEKLTAVGASLRLCKGAYAEPAEIAYQDREQVDQAYANLARTLLASGTYPRLATHDDRLIHHVRAVAEDLSLGRDDFEFQMLYGVREPLQDRLVEEGYRLRIYVPFGSEWFPYFTRRMAERPANLAFFLRALAGRRSH